MRVLDKFLAPGAFESSRQMLEALPYRQDANAAIAAAREALPLLQAAARPVVEAEVVDAMRLMAVDRPSKGKTPEHWSIHKKLFVDALSGYPAEAVRLGAIDAICDEKIFGFPNVGQLLAKVKPHAERIRIAAYRAKVLAEAKPSLPRPPPTPEDKARVAAMMAELRGALSRPKP